MYGDSLVCMVLSFSLLPDFFPSSVPLCRLHSGAETEQIDGTKSCSDPELLSDLQISHMDVIEFLVQSLKLHLVIFCRAIMKTFVLFSNGLLRCLWRFLTNSGTMPACHRLDQKGRF